MPTPCQAYRLDDLVVEVERVRVTRAGCEIPLAKLTFDLLLALIDIAPAVATTDELLARVWPGLVVNAETVAQRVKLLRSALDDDPRSPRYLAVVRGRGYRLLPEVVPLANSPAVAPARDAVAIPEAAVATESPPPSAAPVPPEPQVAHFHRLRGLLILCTVGLVAVVMLALVRGSAGRSDDGVASGIADPGGGQPTAPESRSPAIAVLPFDSLGPRAKEDEFLASGIAESVLHALGTTPEINVIARSSSFAFKGRNIDAREIGRQLHARYLLEGSLQRVDPRLRVRADLIDATSGQSLWSMTVDRPVTDLFTIEDEIANKVAQALSVTLKAGMDDRRASFKTPNFEAYLEYLRGRESAATYRRPDLQAAIQHYTRAIELDPRYSAPFSARAWARYQLLQFRAGSSPAEEWKATQADMRQDLAKALALDDRNADAWGTLATVEDDPDRAEIDHRRAVALEPSLARAQFGLSRSVMWRALSTQPDRLDEMFGLVQKAMQLDPLEPRYPSELAEHYYYRRATEIDKAEPLLDHALVLNPNYLPALMNLAILRFCCQARLADAVAVGEQALKQDPTSTEVRFLLVHFYLAVGDDTAAEALLADHSANPSAWVALHAYRREWDKAVAIMLDDHLHDALPGPLEVSEGELALRAAATTPKARQQALAVLENSVDIQWGEDGMPSTWLPLSRDMGSEVAYADMLQRNGDTVRARRILEMVLRLMDTAAVKYRRGDIWFPFQRSRALAVLGRTEDAFAALATIHDSGHAAWSWQLEADPIFDGMRNDPRFQAFLARRHALIARERAKVDQMRRDGNIPSGPR